MVKELRLALTVDDFADGMTVDRATAWPYDEHGEPGAFVYQRYAHPTGAAAEAALGALEGGDALLYSSGTAAVTAVRVRALPAGSDDRARRRARTSAPACTFAQFAPWGLKVRRVRPDRRAAGGRRRRVGRVAVEPAADAARTGRRSAPIAASSSATRPPRRRCSCGRSTKAPTSSSTPGRST